MNQNIIDKDPLFDKVITTLRESYGEEILDLIETDIFDLINKVIKVVKDSNEFKNLNLATALKQKLGEKYVLVHKKTKLFYNGYPNPNYSNSKKNTLSINNYMVVFSKDKSELKILEKAFKGHISNKENGEKYMYNIIVYEGSEVKKLLSRYYNDCHFLPIEDFIVIKENELDNYLNC